ncbi:hypothetical protein, partial [uncultured Flavobacterium sp.]|uniref:hypothetical protein n=1 Tax=uncultured Flavobacterium sp. TaxID=165435 RepID=UPI0025FFE5AA
MYNSRSNLILGFHGCDESVRDTLLAKPNKILQSEKPYDWLGHGIYFWENNYDRALQWARDKAKRGQIAKASVIGAVLSLDYCLDFTDSRFINMISSYYTLMEHNYNLGGKLIPKNRDMKQDEYKDKLMRELDCTVIEFMHQQIINQIKTDKKTKGFSEYKVFDSARGVFTEGGPAFPGAGIQNKSHIQICIRNSNCIKGFFMPRNEI